MWEKVTDKLPFIDNSDEYIVTIQCSTFTEQARYMCQEIYEVNEDGERTNENWNYIGWSFVYVMLVILTVAFVLLYGKRVFYMAALTMFAPIIGVMYPINRVNGSRAQTLNLWFKEYMGNLLIQPLHLFIYTIFVGIAMQISINNPIYVIIALIAILFVERLLKDMFGIQDTRMGGLGKALQDTIRAIKTTERVAASAAKGAGRMASKGAHGLVNAYENYRNSSEEVETNKKPREQNVPTEEPVEVLSGEVEDNNTQLSTVVRRNSNAQESEVVMDVPYKEVGSEPLEDPNAEESIFPQNEPLRLEMRDDEVVDGAMALNGDNDIIDMNDDDPMQEQRLLPGFLDSDTIDMLDELNRNEDNIDYDTFNPPAPLQEETNSKPLLDTDLNEEFVRSDGERNVYRNRNNGNLRIEPGDTPDFKPPMSVAMAAGSETRPINVGADRTIGSDDSLEGPSREKLRGGDSRRSSQLGGNVSTATSYRNLGSSQNIPDDNNIRNKVKSDPSNIRDNLNVWTNPNEPLPSSKERPEIQVIDGGRGRNVTQGTIPVQGTTSSTIPNSMNSGANATNVNSRNVSSQNVRGTTVNDTNSTIKSSDIPDLNEQDNNVSASDILGEQETMSSMASDSINSGESRRSTRNVNSQNVRGTTVDDANSTIKSSDIPDLNEQDINVSEPHMSEPQGADSSTTSETTSGGRTRRTSNNTSSTETSSNENETFDDSDSERIHRLSEDEYQELPPSMAETESRSRKRTITLRKDEYREIPPNNAGTNNNASATSNNSESERIHRLREDEYQEIPPHRAETKSKSRKTIYDLGPDEYREIPPNDTGANNNAGNAGTNNNTGKNNNSGNAGTNNNTGRNNNSGNAGANNNPGNTGRNNNSGNAGANNNAGNAGTNNNTGNTGANNNPGNAGANNNAGNAGANNNTGDTGANTQDGQGNNQVSNNEGKEPEQYEAKTARKIVDVGETVVGRTAGVVGTAVSGVIDVATSALSGDVGGAIETGVNTTMDSINIATGSPSRSSGGRGTASSSKKTTQSSGNLTKEAETIMTKANVSEAEAIALAEACRALGINDDRNMVLIGNVYKNASSSDKKEIVKLSKVLHRMKEDGKSKNEAKSMLENESISNTTRELLLKMYEKLHV